MDRSTTPSSDLQATKHQIRERLVVEGAVSPDALDRMEVMFDLSRFANRVVRDFESTHRAHGLTWAGFRVLNMLWAVGDVEPSRLAELTGSSRASTSSVLNSLEANGLIVRTTNESDRRLVRVSLTERGSAMLAESIPLQADREQAWLAHLDPEELSSLRNIMQTLMEQPTPS